LFICSASPDVRFYFLYAPLGLDFKQTLEPGGRVLREVRVREVPDDWGCRGHVGECDALAMTTKQTTEQCSPQIQEAYQNVHSAALTVGEQCQPVRGKISSIYLQLVQRSGHAFRHGLLPRLHKILEDKLNRNRYIINTGEIAGIILEDKQIKTE